MTLPLSEVPRRAPQAQLLADLPRAFAALDDRLRSLVEPLSAAERAATPPGGGWSVDQVLEHLCIANEAYMRRLQRADGDPRPASADTEWRASIVGALLIRSLQRPRRLPAPARSQPGPAARADVLPALLASHAAMLAEIARRADADWRSLRFRSPLANVVRLNVGDAACITLAHGRRHAAQIERTIRAVRASAPLP